MTEREKEYREIFRAESGEICSSVSQLLTSLEKDPGDEQALNEIFRLLHNLKANSTATSINSIAEIAHKLETAIGGIRSGTVELNENVATVLFDGIDLVAEQLINLDNPSFVPEPKVIEALDVFVSDLPAANFHLHTVKKYYNSQKLVLSNLIHIRISQLDDLLNMVGELIIDKDRLLSISKVTGNEELINVCAHLERITAELQRNVMDARLVNIGSLFSKFHRIVRDVALVDNKKVILKTSGETIKVDRNILDIISDSLLHIIRNAICHGIEPVSDRQQKGKPDISTIQLKAINDKDSVLIEIKDDGKGIDCEQVKKYAVTKKLVSEERASELSSQEILSFIFEPGFSMSASVNELSGRGVGLDVVKNSIDSIGGKLSIHSEVGTGTTFSMLLPTSLAVKAALLFSIEQSSYAIPLINTKFVYQARTEEIHQVGDVMMIKYNSELIPVVHVKTLFQSDTGRVECGDKSAIEGDIQNIVVVAYHNKKIGLIVDKLIRQQDIVVKSVPKNLKNNYLFGGVTLLGNGDVCLVLDVPSLSKIVFSGVKSEELVL